MAGASLALRPFRVTALGRRGYWRPRRFAAETGRMAGSSSKTSWLHKAVEAGAGKAREAQRSDRRSRLGLEARPSRWQRRV